MERRAPPAAVQHDADCLAGDSISPRVDVDQARTQTCTFASPSADAPLLASPVYSQARTPSIWHAARTPRHSSPVSSGIHGSKFRSIRLRKAGQFVGSARQNDRRWTGISQPSRRPRRAIARKICSDEVHSYGRSRSTGTVVASPVTCAEMFLVSKQADACKRASHVVAP